MNVDKIEKKLLRTMLKQSLKNGVGFTLAEIRKYMPFLDKGPELHNHNVKKLLQWHYGDEIQFALNTR